MSEQMGADPAGLAMAGLTVCAAAIPDTLRVQVQQHDGRWKESARIWTTLVGLPSTKKSPIISAAVSPLGKRDAERFADWQRQHTAWSALDKVAKADQPEPRQQRHRLGDTTVEAAQEVYRGTTTGLLVCADELSGWFGALDKYGGGKGASADRAFWLQAFNGGQMPINRVGRGSTLLHNVSACILGGIQPDAIRRIAADAVDDGLLQRFFPIVLRPSELPQDAPVPPAASLYDMAVRTLTTIQPQTLQFAPEAHEVRCELVRRHHAFGSGEAVSKMLGAHIGKLDGLFARLAIVWHVLSNPWAQPGPVITANTASAVARFMRTFLLPHAVSFYSTTLALSDDQDRLEAIAGYILAHGSSEIDHRTVQRSVRQVRRLTFRDTRPLFETLAAMNWLMPVADPEKRNGEPKWIVNPYVHTRFAERAEREHCRRIQARATIMELSGQGEL
ncbi:DUF3987 domain-containing protein [Sphingomonas sp. MJ1 (PH-R8)]|uniref:DUF3987 domain-containing protein n=1 Tax=Sphingomonas sp. MJ1 (PH-R8) TaxID=3112950 RepID=UPI003A86118E